MRRAALALALTVAASVAPAGPAAAQALPAGGLFGDRPTSEMTTNLPVGADGSVSVEWESDPATCEAFGRCELRGTLTWRLPPTGSMTFSARRYRDGRRELNGSLSLFDDQDEGPGQPVVARVRDRGRLCADEVRTDTHVELHAVDGGRTIAIGLPGRNAPAGAVLSTRCPGPLAADVAAALPDLRLPAAQLLRGRQTLRLGGTGSFAAGGLRGTATSTMSLRLGRPGRERDEVDADDPARLRVAASRFRVAEVRGEIGMELAGAGTDECLPLLSCGVKGTQRLVPALEEGDIQLAAFGRARAGRRAVRAAIGLAPGGRARGIDAIGFGAWSGSGRLEASLGPPGGVPCTDVAPVYASFLTLEIGATRVRAALHPGVEGPLRTRCAGPIAHFRSAVDALIRADVPLRAFGRRRVELTFDRPGTLLDDGWTTTVRPALTLVLEREAVVERVIAPG